MTTEFPTWLTALSAASLVLAGTCAVWTLVDISRRPQKMGVMNVVWPVTMLFGSVVWLAFYRRWGRAPLPGSDSSMPEHPMPVAVAVGASHCGAGCSFGDLLGEFTLAFFPALAVAFGYGWLFSDHLYAAWVLDFVIAYLLGIVLQYFAIAPMRGLGLGAGLRAAVKADTFSITSWQVGMYGTMAIGQLLVLPAAFGHRADAFDPEFWWMMQLAMVVGFATAYPVNWLLIRRGIKEKM